MAYQGELHIFITIFDEIITLIYLKFSITGKSTDIWQPRVKIPLSVVGFTTKLLGLD